MSSSQAPCVPDNMGEASAQKATLGNTKSNRELPLRSPSRSWVVVVYPNSSEPQRLHLCVLPHVKANFGAIVLGTLCKASKKTKHNLVVPGTYFYEDVTTKSMLPMKGVTTQSKTQPLWVDCYPGMVVYFYAATTLPPTEEVEKAVHAWEQVYADAFETAIHRVSGERIANARDPSSAMSVVEAGTTGLTITVVPAPSQATQDAQSAPAQSGASSMQGKTTSQQQNASTHGDAPIVGVATKTTSSTTTNKTSTKTTSSKTSSKTSSASAGVGVEPSKRKVDKVDVVDRLERAIYAKMETAEKVRQAEQNLQEAKKQHDEAQQSVKRLKSALLAP